MFELGPLELEMGNTHFGERERERERERCLSVVSSPSPHELSKMPITTNTLPWKIETQNKKREQALYCRPDFEACFALNNLISK